MKLSELLNNDAQFSAEAGGLIVAGLGADSRAIKPGDVFFALAGTKADGARYAAQAAALGAVAIVADHVIENVAPAHCAVAANPRLALARAAARFYPRQPDVIAAVTGTSGKTSVAAFLQQIWTMMGHQAASVGTVGIKAPSREVYGSLTTPDPVSLHHSLDELAREHVTHLVLEASSHGLDQYRLDGVRLSAAGFTNLSRDHMDYHPSVEHYLAAKLRLFGELLPPGDAAVISADHDVSKQVMEAARAHGAKVFSVGHAGKDIALRAVAVEGFAQRLNLHHAGKDYVVTLPLVGAFQIENALIAAGLAIVTGSEAARVFAALENLKGAKGRLELAGAHHGASIFIDYAHKPDALEKTLTALRPYASGKLIVVFGAGGDRDQGKRTLMGEIAARLADRVIVTDDNPRSEDPAAIRAAIIKAAPQATEIGDRASAIRAAIKEASTGDVVLIAGKGHETGQIVGDQILPFSDHDAVAQALREFAA
jgi:UDP-N-acetylmuramoyl-L-alanyl-D-glutamate--2,6-diaminopimelate ligase